MKVCTRRGEQARRAKKVVAHSSWKCPTILKCAKLQIKQLFTLRDDCAGSAHSQQQQERRIKGLHRDELHQNTRFGRCAGDALWSVSREHSVEEDENEKNAFDGHEDDVIQGDPVRSVQVHARDSAFIYPSSAARERF